MGWSGGTYTRSNGTYSGASVWASDESMAIGIESARHDTHDQDLATGINSCLAKDGSNAATGDLNIGSHKITALASGTARTHALTVAQAQDGSVIWGGTSSGSANAQTITCSPSPGAYATGQTFRFKSGYTNTASATLNVNALGAVTLYKDVNGLRTALGGSDLITNGIYDVTYDSASGGQFILHTSKPGHGAFTPNFAAVAGSASSSGTFRCARVGQLMLVTFFVQATQSVSATSSYTIDLPTSMSSAITSSNFMTPISVIINSGGSPASEVGHAVLTTTQAVLYRNSTAATFASGQSHQLGGSFFYLVD